MFAQAQRLRKTKDIIFVLRKGRRYSTPALSCYFVAKPATLGKVGVIVDTKVSKDAVVRNLLKRRVRAILRERALPSGELIVRLQKPAVEMPFEQLKAQLLQCLRNA